MIKLAGDIKERGLSSHMVLQVHDELVLEVPENEKETAKELVKNSMEQVIGMTPPLKVSLSFGKNWLAAKS